MVVEDTCPNINEAVDFVCEDSVPIQTNDSDMEDVCNYAITKKCMDTMYHNPDQPAKMDKKCNFTETTLISFASQIANGMV